MGFEKWEHLLDIGLGYDGEINVCGHVLESEKPGEPKGFSFELYCVRLTKNHEAKFFQYASNRVYSTRQDAEYAADEIVALTHSIAETLIPRHSFDKTIHPTPIMQPAQYLV
jgi:hypothetical protein